jgi:hypothetical protein
MPNETNEIDERTIALMAAAIFTHHATADITPAVMSSVVLARQIAAEVQRTRPTGEETGR